jgi:hypothetical protein
MPSMTMYVVDYAVTPGLVMPVAIVFTIVIAFLVPLSVAAVMDYLTFVCDAA